MAVRTGPESAREVDVMGFVLGLAIGTALGLLAMHIVHEYLDRAVPLDDKNEPQIERTCPPCDGECHQGRNCPAGGKK